MPLKIYNTLTGEKEVFRSSQVNKVKMFVCGPTVYDSPHLGHARTNVAYDIMARYMKLKGYEVNFIINITDIDDKIYSKAQEVGVSTDAITSKFTREYIESMSALRIDTVTSYEWASKYIDKMINQVAGLHDKGYAYQGGKDIFFDTSKFKEYGALSNQTKVELLLRRLELNAAKRNQSDFVLWRVDKVGDPSWDSPFGRGRPGWHIEDTAITVENFGSQYDIHGGANELIYPHHEAEIAQAEAFTGVKPFVRYWVHTAILNVGGEKMSKSLGNIVTIKEGIKRFGTDVLRLCFASYHYRHKINFLNEDMKKASTANETMRKAATILKKFAKNKDCDVDYVDRSVLRNLKRYEKRFYSAMDDDFSTHRSVKMMLAFAEEVNMKSNVLGRNYALWALAAFSKMLSVIGILELS